MAPSLTMPSRDSLPHLPAPEIVGWETTLRCNMRCRHCGSTAGAARRAELSTRQALDLCGQIARLGVARTVLTGGETLLRPDWERIVATLLDKGQVVALLTNGWTLGPRLVKALHRLDNGRFHLAVSIDGTPAVHDDIRGLKGSFQRAFDGAQAVRDAGTPVAVITTVSHANLDTLPALSELLLGKLHPYAWQIQTTTPFGRAATQEDLNLTLVEYVQTAAFVARMRRLTRKTRTEVQPGDCLGYLSSLEPAMRDGDGWQGCQAGLKLCGIQSNGNVKGCLSIIDDDFIEGNVLDKGLERLWSHPGAFAFTRRFKLRDLGGQCRGCEAGKLCRGGCSASSISVFRKAGQAPYCIKAVEDFAAKKKPRGRQLRKVPRR
jgi:radical SAM protein with 4Fe4S-binding SPASM domain